jgi:protein involved in polysaccharide export with SLBB domain
MIRKASLLLFVISLLVGITIPASAQMTDDAVVEYVKDGLANGKSQNELMRELLASGVTKEQAQRIKKSIEEGTAVTGGIIVPAAGQQRVRRATTTDSMDLPALEIKDDSIDLLKAEAENEEMEIFGHNIFSNRKLTFAPSHNIPTPPNYRLGAGDEVIIDVWGSNEATIRQTISPDGFINIPNLGLVTLNGMTVKEAESYLRKKLGQIYPVEGDEAASDFKLTLGNIRTIQVNVTGEVEVPGTYSISSLSNVYNALYCAGGVNELGTLRKIQLIRNGKQKAEVDLYDFILNGVIPDGLALHDGDVINVPLYVNLVSLEGSVKRPMYYEMKDGETVQELLDYAGGFAGDAYRSNVNLVRQNGVEYQV